MISLYKRNASEDDSHIQGISVVYLGYLSRILRYPKYTTEIDSVYD